MAKLEIDVPQLKKCCFCLPMKYGLFALGSLKLYLFTMAFSKLIDDFMRSPMPWILSLGIVFSVLLITASIMSNERLYNIYYKCVIFEIVVIIIMFTMVQIDFWYQWSHTSYPADRSSSPEKEVAVDGWLFFIVIGSVMFLGLLIQGYIMLLVRSALINIREAAASTDNVVELESQSAAGKSVEI